MAVLLSFTRIHRRALPCQGSLEKRQTTISAAVAPEPGSAADMIPRQAIWRLYAALYHQKKDYISVPYEPKDDGFLNRLK